MSTRWLGPSSPDEYSEQAPFRELTHHHFMMLGHSCQCIFAVAYSLLNQLELIHDRAPQIDGHAPSKRAGHRLSQSGTPLIGSQSGWLRPCIFASTRLANATTPLARRLLQRRVLTARSYLCTRGISPRGRHLAVAGPRVSTVRPASERCPAVRTPAMKVRADR